MGDIQVLYCPSVETNGYLRASSCYKGFSHPRQRVVEKSEGCLSFWPITINIPLTTCWRVNKLISHFLTMHDLMGFTEKTSRQLCVQRLSREPNDDDSINTRGECGSRAWIQPHELHQDSQEKSSVWGKSPKPHDNSYCSEPWRRSITVPLINTIASRPEDVVHCTCMGQAVCSHCQLCYLFNEILCSMQ